MSNDNATSYFGEFNRLKCPECGEASPVNKWSDCEIFCEDCGDHGGIKCPSCDETFDRVFGYGEVEGVTLKYGKEGQTK